MNRFVHECELGLIRSPDGALLDNRDGFYDEHPDTIETYDCRTHVAVSRALLSKLIALANAGGDADIHDILSGHPDAACDWLIRQP
jgi:hypothetical protein